MQLIGDDPVLKPMIRVMTPTQSLVGIAGNFSGDNDAAKTFLGIGLIPSDRQTMRQWNEYGVAQPYVPGQPHDRRRAAARPDRRGHGTHPGPVRAAARRRLPVAETGGHGARRARR